MNEEKIILYDSPEAAKFETNISGWVAMDGHFFGTDEHFARWSGCTHLKCKECGTPHRKSWTLCKKCRDKKQEEKEAKAYAAMEIVEWDGKVPVVICGGDTYFTSWDQINDHCEEFECSIQSLRLVICEGVPLPDIDITYHFCDVMHEDQSSDDIDTIILNLADDLNKAIQEAGPMTYHEGNQAVKV